MVIAWDFIVLLFVCSFAAFIFILILIKEAGHRCFCPKLLRGYSKFYFLPSSDFYNFLERHKKFRTTLARMKDLLEAEYSMEIWENKIFYRKYIRVYFTLKNLFIF